MSRTVVSESVVDYAPRSAGASRWGRLLTWFGCCETVLRTRQLQIRVSHATEMMAKGMDCPPCVTLMPLCGARVSPWPLNFWQGWQGWRQRVIPAGKIWAPSVRSSSPHVSTVTFTCCLTHSVRCNHELRPDWCYLTPCLRLSADKAYHNSELQLPPIAALQPFLRYELGS